MWRVTNRMLDGLAWCVAGAMRSAQPTVHRRTGASVRPAERPAQREINEAGLQALSCVLGAVPGARDVFRELSGVEQALQLSPGIGLSLVPGATLSRAAAQLEVVAASGLAQPHRRSLFLLRDALLGAVATSTVGVPDVAIFSVGSNGSSFDADSGWPDTVPGNDR